MSYSDPFTQNQDVYSTAFTELFPQPENFEHIDLSMSDDELDKMLISALNQDYDHWNKLPWNLKNVDVDNTNFLLGQQLNSAEFLKNDSRYLDNRLFTSVRAILSYATGQLAKPEITPSRGDVIYLKGARDIGAALYQHSADEKVEQKVRAAVLNLISRKRGYLKLRWDPDIGLNGDIVTDIVPPEDIIISRDAGYLKNPSRIFHRIECTVEELCAKFPSKDAEIKEAFSIKRGVHSQMSQLIHYFECWFTYRDKEYQLAEGVCWFLAEKKIVLDKMPNPNWVYFKNRKKERQANVMSMPPKPFVNFNYINTGHSYIDETCLVEQARPMQEMLNKRGRQIWENADYVNGRWVADKNSFSQEDARNLINKGAKTVAMVDMKKAAQPLQNIASTPLPQYVEATLYDARNEIDGIMGTPSQFKGSQPDKKDTLGRDIMIKQQAGALQDDLVRCVGFGMEEYYKIKLQMMRVYYTDDYWFQCKGADGKYEFILLNGDRFDTNVKVGVEVDSTLPLDKAQIRATAMELWTAGNAIDIKTLYEDLGLPNPDVRAERYLKSNTDPVNYLKSIEISQINADAESDIMLLIANKEPEERDDYDQDYFDYFNEFLTTNRFQKLQGEDPDAAQRIVMFLAAVQHTMMQGLNMKETLDDAEMIPTPDAQPGMPGQPGMEQPVPPGAEPPIPGAPTAQPPLPSTPDVVPEEAPPVPTQ